MKADTLRALKERIGDRVVVCSVSGGKDSTAMCLHLRELGIPYQATFFDTGWEDAGTYRYLDEDLPGIIGPIERLGAVVDLSAKPALEAIALEFEERMGHRSAMVRLILLKGMLPSRVRRFCTQTLKVFVARDHLLGLDAEPINAVGIRAQESRARSQMPEWEESETFDCDVWRPLIDWTYDDVISIHKRHDVRPNPLYLQGAERVGCWPCIFARKAEIRQLADLDIGRVAVLRDLEIVVGELAAARRVAKGKEPAENPPTWFQDPTDRRKRIACPGCGGADDCVTDCETRKGSGKIRTKRSGKCWPIDGVIGWARTSRGGRQFELFAPSYRDQGCMRWGMCDHGPE